MIVVCIVRIVNKPRELELMWESDIHLKQSGIFKHCCQHEKCFSLYHLQYILILNIIVTKDKLDIQGLVGLDVQSCFMYKSANL